MGGDSLLKLIVVLVVVGIAFNIYSQKNAMKKLFYKRELSHNVVEIGEEFEVTTTIENLKWLPISFLQIKERLPLSLDYKLRADIIISHLELIHKMTMLVWPFQRITRSYKLYGKERGIHMFREVDLTTGDFLGIGTNINYIDYLNQYVVVLPKPLPLAEVLQPYGDYNGEISVRRWIIEDPILTTGIREYTGNEAEKSIHWPSSLRAGQLMVKNFDFTSDNNAMVIINGETSRPYWKDTDFLGIERCYSLARGVLEDLEKLGIPYGISSNISAIRQFFGTSITPVGYGGKHLSTMLEALGRADFSVNTEFELLLSTHLYKGNSFKTFVVITPVVLEETINSINLLIQSSARVILITLKSDNLEKISGKAIKLIYKNNEI